jgi:hypothetical protein
VTSKSLALLAEPTPPPTTDGPVWRWLNVSVSADGASVVVDFRSYTPFNFRSDSVESDRSSR